MKIDEEASGFTSAWGNREALVSALVEVGRGYYGRLHVLPLFKLTVATFKKWQSTFGKWESYRGLLYRIRVSPESCPVTLRAGNV